MKINLTIASFAVLFFIVNIALSGCDLAGEKGKVNYEELAKKAEDLNSKKDYKGVIALLKSHVNDKDNKSSYFFNELGVAQKHVGKIDRAIESLSRSILLDPNDSLAYMNLGGLYKENGMPEKAIPLFEKYLELDPAYKNRDRMIEFIETYKK